MARFLLFLTTVSLSCLLTGCGSGGPKLYPVTGELTYKGQPVEGATVSFHPADGSFMPTAKTDSQGNFELTTGNFGMGAPSGQYQVTVQKFEVLGTKKLSTASQGDEGYPYAEGADEGMEIVEKKPVVPQKYLTAAETPLQFAVEPGGEMHCVIELED